MSRKRKISANLKLISRSLHRAFSHPLLFFTGLLSGMGALGLAIWLPNAEFLRLVFRSDTLDIIDKLYFLLELYEIAFRSQDLVQAFLMVVFMISTGLLSVVFWLTIYLERTRRIKPDHARAGLSLGIIGTGLTLIGTALLTPIVTKRGLIFNYELIAPGTFLSLLGLFIMWWSILLLARVTRRQ